MLAAGGAAGAAAPMSGRSDSGSLDGKGRWRRCGAGQLATAAARSDGGFFFCSRSIFWHVGGYTAYRFRRRS